MSDRELWEQIWRAVRMIEKAIARRWGFGEFRDVQSGNVIYSEKQD